LSQDWRTLLIFLVSKKAPATFDHHDLNEGDRFCVGSLEVEVIATPGHSPDSICLCLFESGRPVALFSGDTLFAAAAASTDRTTFSHGASDHPLWDRIPQFDCG
jgi:glyoxylase-like metal-dependent hydrolase (beta-lactamase superfamily II)